MQQSHGLLAIAKLLVHYVAHFKTRALYMLGGGKNGITGILQQHSVLLMCMLKQTKLTSYDLKDFIRHKCMEVTFSTYLTLHG